MQVMRDLDACFVETGLTPLESKPEGVLCVASHLTYGNNNILITAVYHQDMELVETTICIGEIPIEKRLRVVQLINEINSYLMCEHFALHTDTGLLLLRAGLYVPKYFLDKDQLKLILQQLMGKGYEYYPLITDAISYKKNPKSIMRRYLRQRENRLKDFENEEKKKEIPQDAQ